ncbi:DUF397 domain-containing protein [Streptomyces himalayensis]|uniref:DUF397 domain-containing protein n=1 Tax=Streptomyces himalayensis subsp. himalayensis TaxID=2756131 RepID=A0A7W0DUF9_9ACTN|nr:DUF397 domain-containing protein [Streptomyces himalayensis]MBA2950649.1 DUF397 domain-containing protein [Streptomyces himalayensis subsp. himalayensis]
MTTPAEWQKSSFSGGGEGNDCIELAAFRAQLIHLRESDTPATRLTTTPAPLAHLILGIKSGRLSNTRPA